MSNFLNIKNKIYILAILFIWTLWVVYPMINSGFIGDDAYNSLILGFLIQTGVPLWEHTFIEINSWATGAGRIWPFQWIYLYGLYGNITQNLLAIKFFTYFVIFVDVYLFYKILRTLTKSRDLSLLCAVIVPLFFQFRWFHDPILSFTFLMPMMCLFMLSSSILLIDYLENSKRTSLLFAVLIYILALLTYEIAYASVFLYIGIIALNSNKRRGIIFIIIMGLLTAFHLLSSKYLVNLHLEKSDVQTYVGANFNFDFINVLKAFFIQLTAAIPLSWKFAEAPFHQKFYKIGLENLIIYSLFATFFTRALFSYKISSVNKSMLLKGSLFSFFLLVGPALAMALSGHQQELLDAGFGYAYTPVFIQYFGLSIFFIMFLLYLKDKVILKYSPLYRKAVFIFIWSLILIIGAITREENILIVEKSNQFYKYPRDLLGAALEEGLVNGITEKDLILRNERYPSDYYTFYNQMTGKKMNLCGFNIKHQFPSCLKDFEGYSIVGEGNPLTLKKRSSGKTYGITYFLGKNFITGSVLIAEINEITLVNGLPMQVIFRDYKIFNYLDRKITAYSSDRKHDFLKLISYELERDMEGYDLSNSIISEVSVSYKGFHLEERRSSGDEYLRWSSGKSELVILNTSDSHILVRIDMLLIRPKDTNGDAQASILLSYGDKVINYDVDFEKKISLTIKVKPGLSNLKLTSDLPSIANGDPREIVFGIGNYKVNQLRE